MSKKKKIISSIIGVMALVYVGCGNVATSEEQADIDTIVTVATEATIDDSIEANEEATDSVLEASSSASTETSSGEAVDAVAETSVLTDSSELNSDSNVAGASRNSEAVNTSNSTSGTLTGKTGPNGWPIISGYTGADGNGPGLAWRDDYDYANDVNIQGNFNDIIAFTASNGVTIKVVVTYNGDTPIYWPISDGIGKDLEPNSGWMKANNEALYGANGAYNKIDFSANITATLPNTTSKRTSIDPNDPQVVTYKQAYDFKRSTCDGGTYYPRPAGTINDSLFFFTDGVGEYDKKAVALWEFRYTGSYWSLTLYLNPAEYQWSGIREILEYLSPDGAELYNVIYTDCYTGSEVIQEWDTWWQVGNSQIYQPNPDAVNRILTYYFK